MDYSADYSSDTITVLFSKIKFLEPQHAKKIMGFLFMQDFSDSQWRSLAYGPDNLLHSVIIKVKSQISPPPLNPIARPSSSVQNNPTPLTSPIVENNGFLNNPDSISSNSWLPNNEYSNFSIKSTPLMLSYENIRSGSSLLTAATKNGGGESSRDGGGVYGGCLSFLKESSFSNNAGEAEDSGGCLNNGFCVHYGEEAYLNVTASENGGGFRPCHYFARGFCKNGDGCKFVHGGSVAINGGSSSKMNVLYDPQHEDVMRNRLKAALEQRMAAQIMAGVSPMGYDMNPWCCRPDMISMGLAQRMNSVARQIYLTFPAESSFSDEDVSEYFSKYGPVQDVRIPCQQQRMFGFVTFFFPESVEYILARRNPHYICASRVLVKPYKEKGRLSDKKQRHLQGNYLTCTSPSGLDYIDTYESQLGARTMYNTPTPMYTTRTEEQPDLQQAFELNRKQFMNLQLANDINYHNNCGLTVGPRNFLPNRFLIDQNGVLPPNVFDHNSTQGSAVTELEETTVYAENSDNNNSKDLISETEGFDHHEHRAGFVNQSLYDNLFASPTDHTVGLASTGANESTTAASLSEDNKSSSATSL